MRPPTDFEILKAINDRHREGYLANVRDPNAADHLKIYVPIDIQGVADRLGVNENIVFGRLYYHLEPKYGSETEDGTKRPFFYLKLGSDPNCVNFPLLQAVLAGLWQERRHDLWAVYASSASLGIALASLFVSIFVR